MSSRVAGWVTRKNFVANANDEAVALIVQPATGVIGVGCSLLQGGVGRDHLARDQIVADAEMLKRALRLRAPEFVGGNCYITKGILLDPSICLAHDVLPGC